MTKTTVRLLGADPIDHRELAQLAAAPPAGSRGSSLEVRLLAGLEFRDLDVTKTSEGTYTRLRGKAVPYGEWASIGYYLEQFTPGSLAKSIADANKAGRALPLNLFHDNRSFPIGAAASWEDERSALIGEWAIDAGDDEDGQRAQRAARHADEGRLTGLSIEFSPIRSEWELVDDWNPSLGPDHMDRCTRTEARLSAVGLVQAPAYVSAGVELVRAANARARGDEGGTPRLDAWRAELDKLRG